LRGNRFDAGPETYSPRLKITYLVIDDGSVDSVATTQSKKAKLIFSERPASPKKRRSAIR
jgi:cystathionine beta-lyase/cystathionine gamma-synthase